MPGVCVGMDLRLQARNHLFFGQAATFDDVFHTRRKALPVIVGQGLGGQHEDW